MERRDRLSADRGTLGLRQSHPGAQSAPFACRSADERMGVDLKGAFEKML
jgi:hypothetical protein